MPIIVTNNVEVLEKLLVLQYTTCSAPSEEVGNKPCGEEVPAVDIHDRSYETWYVRCPTRAYNNCSNAGKPVVANELQLCEKSVVLVRPLNWHPGHSECKRLPRLK